MKKFKAALLFYNSILIFSLTTIGLVTSSYQNLAPVLLLLPVGVYFALSLVNNITKLDSFVKDHHISHNINHARKILRFYSLFVILLLIFANLVSSANFLQTILTLIFLPFIASFLFDFFDKKSIDQFRLEGIITLTKFFNSIKSTEKLIKKEKTKAKKKTKGNKKEKAELVNEVEGEVIEEGDEYLDKEREPYDPELDEEVENDLVTDKLGDMLDIKDHKRRQFLKIIGGGGVSMFLMLFVFQNKAQAAFFGSAPGPGVVGIKDSSGTKIDPAEKQPTDGYNISEVDDSTSPSYYGFVHKNGAWYIAKEDSGGAYRYVSGASAFSTSWTNRASLTYDYFDSIF